MDKTKQIFVFDPFTPSRLRGLISLHFLKLACVERHRATGNIGVALVVGLGLRESAITSSMAHDAHNIIGAGTNDTDIAYAVREVERHGGGLALVVNGEARGVLPLPIAGLLSD